MSVTTQLPDIGHSLEQAVERHILQRTWYRIHRLCVEIDGGRMIVHGRVGSYYSKQLALEAALEMLDSTATHAVDLDIDVETETRQHTPGRAALPVRVLAASAPAR